MNRCRRFCSAEIRHRTIATSNRPASSPKKARSITRHRSRRKSSRAIGRMSEAAAASGITIQSWREYGFLAAIDAWTDVTNAAFDRHWGWNPVTRAEVRPMLTSLWETPVADLSMLATIDGECVGAVFSVPDLSPALARLRRGVRLDSGARGRNARRAHQYRSDRASTRTRRRSRDGGAIVPRDGAAQDALCRLHSRPRRQLALAPHGAQPWRARYRQLRDVPSFVICLYRAARRASSFRGNLGARFLAARSSFRRALPLG